MCAMVIYKFWKGKKNTLELSQRQANDLFSVLP